MKRESEERSKRISKKKGRTGVGMNERKEVEEEREKKVRHEIKG